MGMVLALCTLSDKNIASVLADPPLIWKVIAPDDPEAYEHARKAQGGFLARLFGRRTNSREPVADLVLADGEVAEADLDKAWHGIHYMLTRSAWEGEEPLNFLVSGGTEVGAIDVGYGPARAFTSEEVRVLRAALDPLDEAFLRSRFDTTEMMRLEIYPEIWDRDPAEDDTFAYCAENFHTLKDFVAHAAQRGVGLVIYLC